MKDNNSQNNMTEKTADNLDSNMASEVKVTIKTNDKFSLSKQGKSALPIDGLPSTVRQYIESVCEIYHCPREFVTSAVLTTASTAVGKKIKINEGKYKNSLVLWFVLVARSGSNKSYPMKIVTAPLRKIDSELYAVYSQKYEEWKKMDSKERGEGPRCPALVIDDCTDERRSEILFINPTGKTNYEEEVDMGPYPKMRGAIGIYPELKGMFDSKNQYQQGGTAGISKLLRLFDCEDIKIDRRNGFTMLVHDPFFNIIGDLQTGMLKATFGSELFMTNGLNQRFLFCVAQEIEYPLRSHAKLPREIEYQWERLIRLLYEGIYHDGYGHHITLFRSSDGIISLSEGADRLYEQYFNSLQKKKELSKTDYESSIYSKLQIQVLRFAGIVHALEVAEEKGFREDYNILHENTMEYAIRCVDYFEKMALLVYEKLMDAPLVKGNQEMSNSDILRQFMMRFPNVSQNQLARLINRTPAYISQVKNGKA